MKVGAYANRHRDDMIATVTPWGDHWRLTTWLPDGATGHTVVRNDKDLARELSYGWQQEPSAEAEALLDSWVGTPVWERGCKRALVLQCWNACSFYGRFDLARRLDYAPDLDSAVAYVPGIYRELEKGE